MMISATKKDSSRGTAPWITAVILISLVGFLCFFSAWWYVRTYGRLGFDSVMFTLTGNLNGVNVEHLLSYLAGGALPALAATALGAGLLHLLLHRRQLRRMGITILVAAVSLGLTLQAAWNVGLAEYWIQGSQTTSVYEEHYVDPRQVDITFPEEKRNLVYIILESMEVSYLSKQQGGGMEENLIPGLYSMARENVNFSHNADVGGFRDVTGTTWTMGALVAQSAGVPLRVTASEDGAEFLPGLYTLSDILREHGYRQAFMVGSDGDFGGRKTYFTTHGVDDFYDLYTAWDDGVVPDGYDNQFWGLEDGQLYEYAKETLSALSQSEQPFAFTLLTVDTHSPSGYVCQQCQTSQEEAYANVVCCADRQVSQFVSWLQEQDFYENTTVVIVGDHSSMNNGFFLRNMQTGYTRHIYNCFLQAAAEPAQTQNRQFSTLDLFPTTLAALGCSIPGDRLGLGTNLFSGEPTLVEQYGYDWLCGELRKSTDYYDLFLQRHQQE